VTSCKHTNGVYRVVSAPFDPPGALDLESLRRLVGFLADTGAEALLVLGPMGEAPTLVARERDAVIATSVEAAGPCPLIVGATSPSVAGTSALMREAAAGGAAAVLIAPPRLGRAAGEDGPSRAHARGAGDEDAAVFFPYLALIRREFQEGVGLAIRKHIYKLRGLIEHDCVRSPGVELDSGTIAGLRELLRWSKLDEVAASA
jgi:dihydrodipicolinate synthase/N-acetylneuraminate lyase